MDHDKAPLSTARAKIASDSKIYVPPVVPRISQCGATKKPRHQLARLGRMIGCRGYLLVTGRGGGGAAAMELSLSFLATISTVRCISSSALRRLILASSTCLA